MYIDKNLMFSDAQSMVDVTATTRTPSTYSVDLGAAGDADKELFCVIRIDTAFAATGGAMNVTFTLETHTADDFAAAKTVLWSSGAIAKATLVAGYEIKFRVQRGMKRYLAVTATPDTNTVTAGKFDAFLVQGIDTNK